MESLTTIGPYTISSKDIIAGCFFGKIYRAKAEKEDRWICIRRVSHEVFNINPSINETMHQLIELLQKSKEKPPNLVLALALIKSQNYCYIISEYCEGGNLLQYLWSQGDKLSSKERLLIIRSVFSAVMFLAKYDFKNYNIKYENMLLASGTWKLDICGANLPTLHFLIPKIIETDHNSLLAKIWAIAVLNYRLANGCFPLESDADDDDLSELHSVITQIPSDVIKFLELKEKVVTSMRSLYNELSKTLTQKANELMKGCLDTLSARNDREKYVQKLHNLNRRDDSEKQDEEEKDTKNPSEMEISAQKGFDEEDFFEENDPYSRFLYFHLRKR